MVDVDVLEETVGRQPEEIISISLKPASPPIASSCQVSIFRKQAMDDKPRPLLLDLQVRSLSSAGIKNERKGRNSVSKRHLHSRSTTV
ncbi:hypothetical protein Ccrd_025246 [Cynara cardunculus var. scolymus]|uniref:Uncharacterized protein n=1 Tax=Cynara cardunculus var. scolymus TaxID=59895 RepID=A0A103XB68_CYNCS|nr:hypothetical protein Ccrd_025246 [Cynara cardunculus var. scolymus]